VDVAERRLASRTTVRVPFCSSTNSDTGVWVRISWYFWTRSSVRRPRIVPTTAGHRDTMTLDRTIEQGETEVEDAIEEAFVRLVSEGDERLHRALPEQIVTGLLAGLEVEGAAIEAALLRAP
jgi:hypothetical protein